MTWLFPTLVVLFAIVSLAMVLIILVQRPQGGGLASAFGGGGNQDTAFGGRTGDALTIATVSTFVVWLLVAIGLNVTDGMAVAEPTVTPVVGTPPGEAAVAPDASPPVTFTTEETEQLISPTAPATVVTPDRPVIQPGLEGFPLESVPVPAPSAPPAEPAPAPAANP